MSKHIPTREQFESKTLPEYTVVKVFRKGIKWLYGDIFDPYEFTYEEFVDLIEKGKITAEQ